MDKIKLILTLITIAITVIPIVGALLTYQNNLMGLFVPPEINEIADKLSGSGGGDGGSDGPQVEPVGPPEYDPVSHTIRQSIAFKNTFPLDITLKSMSGDVQCVEQGFDVGVASIEEPVSIPVGETRTVTLLITWTDDGLAHFGSAQTQGGHAGEETVEVMLVNVSVDISGIQLQLDQNMMDQRMEIPNPAL